MEAILINADRLGHVVRRTDQLHGPGTRLAGDNAAPTATAYFGIDEGLLALNPIVLFHGDGLELTPFHACLAAFALFGIDFRYEAALPNIFDGKAAAIMAIIALVRLGARRINEISLRIICSPYRHMAN